MTFEQIRAWVDTRYPEDTAFDRMFAAQSIHRYQDYLPLLRTLSKGSDQRYWLIVREWLDREKS